MDPLDRQIADAVNVDPSPAFVARVRARVSTEGTPARRSMSPFLVAGAVLATIAVAVWVMGGNRAPSRTPPAARVDVPAAPPVHVGHATVLTRIALSSAPATRSGRQPRAPVIVAMDERRGLHQLADLVRDGRVTLIFPDANSEMAPPVEDIVVSPIDIAPLTVASNWEQGDEQ